MPLKKETKPKHRTLIIVKDKKKTMTSVELHNGQWC